MVGVGIAVAQAFGALLYIQNYLLEISSLSFGNSPEWKLERKFLVCFLEMKLCGECISSLKINVTRLTTWVSVVSEGRPFVLHID